MTRRHLDPPKDVLEALDMLERATSPIELGHAYQILLDWRRDHPLGVFVRNAAAPFAALAFAGLLLVAMRYFEFEITDYWRGFLQGVWVAWLLWTIRDWIVSRPPPQMASIETRIESAIDRWRHAVPAMREIPR